MRAVKWFLLGITYLCFVAELAFIIRGDIDHGILFAGLCFCLLVVFFVLWREEQAHQLMTLQSNLDDAVRSKTLEHQKKDSEQMKRLRQEKEELACEREQITRRLEKLTQENETLTGQLAEAKRGKADAVMRKEAESILPHEEALTQLDLVAVSSDVMAKMENACREAGIRLCLSCSKETLPYRADERYIRLILQNIIDNAIKYMQRNGSLVITISHLGNSIFFAFKDDGMGLSPKETAHVFELNYQGTNKKSGNGLGLAQVRAVVCHLGGTVYARSTDGMGIYIELPLDRQAGGKMQGVQEEKAGEVICDRGGEQENSAGGK